MDTRNSCAHALNSYASTIHTLSVGPTEDRNNAMRMRIPILSAATCTHHMGHAQDAHTCCHTPCNRTCTCSCVRYCQDKARLRTTTQQFLRGRASVPLPNCVQCNGGERQLGVATPYIGNYANQPHAACTMDSNKPTGNSANTTSNSPATAIAMACGKRNGCICLGRVCR